MHFDVTIFQEESQVGKPRQILTGEKFEEKKIRAETLADAYLYLWKHRQPGLAQLWEKRYTAVLNCATWLAFKTDEQGKRRLAGMNSCRCRLCPMCTWRRSLKTYHNMRKITDYIATCPDMPTYKYVFLTLTVKSCAADQLGDLISELYKGQKRLRELKAFRAMCKGYFCALEVTHNKEQDTYHPHFHMVIAVLPSYFKSRYYISQAAIREMWRDSMRLDYDPQVWIKKIDDLSGAAAEVAKYPIKDDDIISPDNWDLSADAVAAVDLAIKGRRLIGYGGIFRELHRKLNLDDEENGDLIHTDGEDAQKPTGDDWESMYFWHSGFRQYIKIEKRREVIDV